jgi:hypothetical protein
MAGEGSAAIDDSKKSADRAIEWTSHLIAERPVKGVALLAITVLLCILVQVVFEHWLYVVVAAVILFFSTMRFYFP